MDLTRSMVIALALASGCGDSGSAPADLSAALDLTTPDLAVIPFCMVTGSQHQRFYLDTIKLPVMNTDYAIDLNGDGTPENQLGNIVGALKLQGSDPQANLNAAIANGSDVLLLDETSSDPTFTSDGCAGSNLYQGKTQVPLDWDAGAQNYLIDPKVNPGLFTGPIAAGRFSSSPPTAPPDIQMLLALPISGKALTPVPVHAGHLQYTDANGFVVLGQINGAILSTDVQSIIIPAIAAALEATVAANPNSQQSKQIKVLFDLGDGNGHPCTNPDGTMGVPNDGVIAECEIASSSLIQSLLAPDVQLFQNGVYQPNPANTKKDAVSVGLSFSAVPAHF
jgi:hypothetical protein